MSNKLPALANMRSLQTQIRIYSVLPKPEKQLSQLAQRMKNPSEIMANHEPMPGIKGNTRFLDQSIQQYRTEHQHNKAGNQ